MSPITSQQVAGLLVVSSGLVLATVAFLRGNYLLGLNAGIIYAGTTFGLCWLLVRAWNNAGSSALVRLILVTIFSLSSGFALAFPGLINPKEDLALQYRARFQGAEGILFVGKAQEKTPVFRTEKRKNLKTGQTYPWIVRSTAMINHFYFYGLDEDFK